MKHSDISPPPPLGDNVPGVSRRKLLLASLAGAVATAGASLVSAVEPAPTSPPKVSKANKALDDAFRITYRTQKVGDVEVFYREAGRKEAPVLLLLHGFPTSSHMFRNLMPLLANDYRLIAPDLPGFGNTKAPARGKFDYTFDNLYKVIEGFTEALELKKYSLYVFDYGAPTGFRLAAANPEKITAIISQNGNAYLEGLSDQWGAWQTYWREPTVAHREACRVSLAPDTIRDWQYGTGADLTKMSPDGYNLDILYMARPGAEEIQLDLVLDYRSNVAAYPAFHEYFRKHQPPLLAVWGKFDPAFIPAGAEAYHHDLPRAEVHLLETGHFALETHAPEVGEYIREFLSRTLKS
ncbi:alpha/beta fold hydrolase [Pseudomonas petrae]|uniref:Alpha/beta hydrolase n=1 Tax=Pseudomonas petrae TaxID=2912190 RepID=A0ABS9IDC2_9PSED|nr:alpha/beta hydrolase [Pseudomonas petrae]MCF7545432.1 alpha/beta hydrolase [Pseudomonas petrae]